MNGEVKDCVEDMVSAIDHAIENSASSFLCRTPMAYALLCRELGILEATDFLSRAMPPGKRWCDRVDLEYQIIEKERVIQEESSSYGPEVYCEYCGDGGIDVCQRRGGGGLDSMMVTWDEDTSRSFFSCQSCGIHDKEEWVPGIQLQREESCIGCGIHKNLLVEEVGEDYIEKDLSRVCLCLEDSTGITATDYYFCEDCMNRAVGADYLEKLAIERIKKIQRFLNQDECDDIRIAEGYDYPEIPVPPNRNEVQRRLFEDSDEESTLETYLGEYENEDLPENNTEKAREIKEVVKEVGGKIFDVQEQLKEGDYLEIMDLLQKVTNKVNSL